MLNKKDSLCDVTTACSILILSLTSSQTEENPISSPPSTDSNKSSGDGCFLTLLDWLSRVRGEHKRADKGGGQSEECHYLDASDSQTEFLAELLYEELYDDCTGGGKKDTVEVNEDKHAGDGFASKELNNDYCDITVEQTNEDDVNFVLGDNDTSRTPLSILKAEVLEFGNDDKKKTPPVTRKNRKTCYPTIIPETPVFDQISMISLNTSETPLLDGSVLNSPAEDKLEAVKQVRTKLFKSGSTYMLLENVDTATIKVVADGGKSNTDSDSCRTDSHSISLSGDNDESEKLQTPLKSLENMPSYQTSPFIKKLCTDKVTKRTRRKRHMQSSIENNDWSDVSDAKELCQGLDSSPESYIPNKADAEWVNKDTNQCGF